VSTLTVNTDDRVLCAEILAPPMSLLGPELVSDESRGAFKVLRQAN
jgi:hypothetical protein